MKIFQCKAIMLILYDFTAILITEIIRWAKKIEVERITVPTRVDVEMISMLINEFLRNMD